MSAAAHTLRPYQVEAIVQVELAWDDRRDALVVMATGLGKTTVFAEIARRARDQGKGRVLVLAHRIELVDQAAARLRSIGLSVEVESGDRRASLMDTSDAVVATVQTMRGRRLAKWNARAFGTVIIDEAHHAIARNYRAVLDHFGEARILGVTATPDRGDDVALGEIFGGGVSYAYGLWDGIRAGYLCDIRAKTVDLDCVSLEGVRTTAQAHGRDLAAEDIAKAMTGDEPMHAIAAPLAGETKGRKTLVFMPSVELTHELARVLSGYVGGDRVRSLDGTTDGEIRAQALRDYSEGGVDYLINCALFTEGFDAPATSCVAIARPTKSRALYAQMVGRGTRLHPSKSDLLVLDFYPANTRHNLAHIADIFDGKGLDAHEAEAMDAALRKGETILDSRKQAKEASERREAARAAERERAAIVARARYEARERDVWTVDAALGVTAAMYADNVPPAHEQQLARLAALRIEVHPRETVASASRKIKAATERHRNGLCTLKQARVLARAGMSPDLTFDQARTAMDMLVANKWKATPDMLARWGGR